VWALLVAAPFAQSGGGDQQQDRITRAFFIVPPKCGDKHNADGPPRHTGGLRYLDGMHAHGGHDMLMARAGAAHLACRHHALCRLWWAGIRAHSLALLSEAGHNLSDFLALLLSLVAVYLEGRPPSATKTYGYRRAGVLAALVNSLSLVAVSFFIFYEALHRIQHPEHVRAGMMIWVAAAGVVMNGAIALLLWRSARTSMSTSAARCCTRWATRSRPRP